MRMITGIFIAAAAVLAVCADIIAAVGMVRIAEHIERETDRRWATEGRAGKES